MLRNAGLAVIVALNGALGLAQQPSKPLSLAECIKIAEERHPDLAAVRDEVRAAEAHLRGAHAAYLPRVDFGASYIRQTYNFAGTPGTEPRQVELFYRGESSATAPYYYGGLSLTQTVYDFGHTKGTVKRSESELQASRRNVDRERQLIDLGVRTAYYQVLAAKELVRIRQEAVDNQSKHLEQVQAFFQVGTRPKIDVTRQEVALANARVDLRQAQANLDVAKAALATSMGLPIEQSPEPADSLNQEQETESLPQLLAEAGQNRPDVLAQRAQVDAARADIIVAHSNFRPNLSLASFFDYRNLKLPLVYNWSIGQLVAQNFFAGGADRALMAQTQAQADAAQHALDSLLQQVRQQVLTAFSDLSVAKDRIALAIETEAEARENLELAEGRYRAGYGNIIELTDAQLLETDSQAQVITSRYDYQTAAARLDAAVGK